MTYGFSIKSLGLSSIPYAINNEETPYLFNKHIFSINVSFLSTSFNISFIFLHVFSCSITLIFGKLSLCSYIVFNNLCCSLSSFSDLNK